MIADKFIGTWKLISYEFKTSTDRVVYYYSQNPVGILMYDAHGNMNVQIMNPDRPAFASGSPIRGTPEEIKKAYEGYSAYFGTYEINEEESTVIHHIEGNFFPNHVGNDYVRYFRFSGNRLTLTMPPIQTMGEETLTGVLVWERA